jgi:hypothetical protein
MLAGMSSFSLLSIFSALGIIALASVAAMVVSLPAHANPIEPSIADSLLSTIPKDGEIPGWARDGAPALCFDESSLSEYIDGAAPYYLERGAVAVLFQYYQGPTTGEDVRIEIYRMRDDTSACGLFGDIVKDRPASDHQETREIGQGRHLDQALLGVYLLEFHEGPFFVRVDGKGKGLGAKRAVVEFGNRISRSLRAQGPAPR